jgi:uncharacterized membrane protein YfcA
MASAEETDMEIIIAYLVLGLFAGTLSGLVGIGGGVIIVPVLIFLFKFSQHSAQGTTLALMVPPVGILAAIIYYRHGYVDLKAAGIICLGFVLGGLIGSRLATSLPSMVLEKIFGVGLLLIALKMLLGK